MRLDATIHILHLARVLMIVLVIVLVVRWRSRKPKEKKMPKGEFDIQGTKDQKPEDRTISDSIKLTLIEQGMTIGEVQDAWEHIIQHMARQFGETIPLRDKISDHQELPSNFFEGAACLSAVDWIVNTDQINHPAILRLEDFAEAVIEKLDEKLNITFSAHMKKFLSMHDVPEVNMGRAWQLYTTYVEKKFGVPSTMWEGRIYDHPPGFRKILEWSVCAVVSDNPDLTKTNKAHLH